VTYSSLIRLRFPPEVLTTAFPSVPFVPPFVLAGVRGFLGVVAGLEVPVLRAAEVASCTAGFG